VINLIDKLCVGVAAVALPDRGIIFTNLLGGLTIIFFATLPLGLLIAAIGYNLSDGVALKAPDAPRNQARILLFSSLCAIVVPLAYMLSRYALGRASEIPVFYLSFSYLVVPVLSYTMIAVAAIALALYSTRAITSRRALAVGTFLPGLLVFLLALSLLTGLPLPPSN
jgi:predicted secreted protein